MKIGIDMEKVERFILEKENQFIKNNFTSDEISHAFKKSKPEESLCSIFSAKEAFIKTLKNQKILLKDIEIIHNEKGKPFILLKKIKKRIDLSISNCNEYVIAVVINFENV